MYYLDQRLSKILSDNRVEKARSLERRKLIHHGSIIAREKIGLLLIAKGEKLARRRAKVV